MSKVFLRCRDYHASAETINLDCELNERGYIDFDDGPHDVATEQGEDYEFDLYNNGNIDFGKEYIEDRIWRTDLHELKIQLGEHAKITNGGGPWTYEVIRVQ
jgi:hypothetical protein